MATFTNKRLCLPHPITDTLETVYTVPAGTTTIVSAITLCNPTGAGVADVCVYLVPSGESASNDNIVVPSVSFDAKSSANLAFGLVIHVGDTIQVVAAGPGVTLHLSGIEIT
jgi:hypothetical protein